jgi:hypothetical protein
MGEKITGGTILGLAGAFVLGAIIFDILHSKNSVPLLQSLTKGFSQNLKTIAGQ